MTTTLKRMKYEGLKFSEKTLIKERENQEKLERKYLERINEDYTLTEKQFDELQKKKDKCELKIDQLTYGIRLLSEEIKMLCYQLRMESEDD